MFSKLLQLDTNDVTPARAAATFQKEVSRLVREDGLSLSDAWAQVKTLEPDLLARISAKNPGADSSALPNGDGWRVPTPFSAVASNKADIARKFLLPANVDEALIKAAWRGNGSQYASVDFIKVFLGVQTQLMQTTGLSSDLARRQMYEDFPALAKTANQMPIIQGGATDTSGMKL
jgi:hypothetical protein